MFGVVAVAAVFGWYHSGARIGLGSRERTAKARADETTAALIWSRLDFENTDDPKSNATVRALWDLANGSPAVRDAFLRQLALDRYQVDTVASAPTLIKRAFGLRPNIEDIARLVGPVLDAVRQTTDPYQLMAVAQAVQTLGPKLSAEHMRVPQSTWRALCSPGQTNQASPKRSPERSRSRCPPIQPSQSLMSPPWSSC